MKNSLFIILFLFSIVYAEAQDSKGIRFGKISPADFDVSSPLIDSNVNAVVISDIGSSEFVANNKGWFTLVFKNHTRIKILNNKGFDAAEVSLYLFSDGSETEKLEEIAANTYNLENGTVVTTKLDKKNIYEERLRRTAVRKKFTFPAVKAGSIIEYSYTIHSDFIFRLRPWDFQGEYPCLWSEYNVSIPDFFNYVFLSQGYLPFDVKKTEDHYGSFVVRSTATESVSGSIGYPISTTIHDMKWVIKNAPPLKEESFTSTLNNHITKIEFQLSEYRFPEQPVKKIMDNWQQVSARMMESDDFGAAFNRANGWMDDEMKKILNRRLSAQDTVQAIYNYVRDHFTCTSTYGYYLEEGTSIKDVFKRRSGTVGEINLLLLAMLRHQNIPSEPVLLSLRSRGVVHPLYPLMDKFNYLICQVTIGDTTLYLDASKPLLGFNKLPLSCYNGTAWVMRKEMPFPIHLSPDYLTEQKQTSVFISNDEKEGVTGSFTSQLGYYESYNLREKMSKLKKEDLEKEIKKNAEGITKTENFSIDSLNQYENPATVKFDFSLSAEEDIIYFSPLLGEQMQHNPFTSAKRFYPVEMPYARDETYLLHMEIPKGYAVEEIPKSVRFTLNGNEGMFEYLCAQKTDYIQLRTTVKINKANFSQEDYPSLRDFFSYIIKKQSEQIVFKKIKQ